MPCGLCLVFLFTFLISGESSPHRFTYEDGGGVAGKRILRSVGEILRQRQSELVRVARSAPKQFASESESEGDETIPSDEPAQEEETGISKAKLEQIKQKAAEQERQLEDNIKSREANQEPDGHILIEPQAKLQGTKPEDPDLEIPIDGIKSSVDATAARWPEGIVPYTIDATGFSAAEVAMIHDTLQYMNSVTCVQFLEASPLVFSRAGHNNYIKIFNGDGCWSYVGMVIRPEQKLSLKHISCFKNKRPILHESMHVLGFHHEQSRSDRNDHVEVIYSNLQKGLLNTDYLVENTINAFPYSYDSIMQYGAYTLAINPVNKSMTSHENLKDNVMGIQDDLSYYDIANINKYYKCQQNCASPPSPGCLSPQIPDERNCGSCACFNGMQGQLCNQAKSTVEGYGGIFNLIAGEKKVFVSPKNGQTYQTGQFVTWFFKAPAGKRLLVNVTYLELALKADDPQFCSHYLELQISSPGVKTQKLCYSESLVKVSDTDTVIILFDSTDNTNGVTGIGFEFTVQPVDPGCLEKLQECVEGTCLLSQSDMVYKCECRENFSGAHCEIDNDVTRVYQCDFELTPTTVICPFESDPESPLEFTYHVGPTTTRDTGPSAAHGGKTYIYLETSWRAPGEYASLYTKVFYAGGMRCLEFWYNMNGAAVGSLEVYYTSQGSPNPVQIFFENRDQGDVWKRFSHAVPDLENVRIWFKAVRGSSYTGDIALDDIVLSPGNCQPHPCESKPCGCGGTCSRDLNNPAAYNCECHSGFSGPNCEFLSTSIECSFEEADSCCFVDQDTEDIFNWSRKKDQTSTLNSGPDNAKAGSYYIFIEASSPRAQGDTACLINQPKLSDSEYCLDFWYHMFGDHMGDLVVSYSNTAVSNRELFRVSGDKGNKWYKKYVTIPGGQNTEVKICGIRGSSYRSDIAIDALSFTPGKCEYKCNCDDGCFLTNDLSDNFDWKSGTGRASGIDTGPLGPHGGTCYMYADMSFPVKDHYTAVLKSTQTFAEKDYRLSFAYSMDGVDVGYLSISAGTKSWIRSGGKGDEWLTDCIDVPKESNLQIRITAARSHSNSGDIAIDDVMLSRGNCGCLSNPCQAGATCKDGDDGSYMCICDLKHAQDDPTCNRLADDSISTSFEDNDPIIFHQLNLPSDYYFSVFYGSTKTWESGPPAAAHGTNYLLAESSKRKPGEKAELEVTLSFTALPRCLKFKYFMYGTGMGSLAVYLNSAVAWYRSGNQGDQWIEGAVDFIDQKVRFVAVRGVDLRSDIALDDIRIEDESCGCAAGFCLNGGTCNNATFVCSCLVGFGGDKCEKVSVGTSLFCDSEGGTECFLKQAVNDQLDWTVYSGPTRSLNTGPPSAHAGSYYLYVDSSSVQGAAQLTTSHLNILPGPRCFTFWYYMYGADVGTLSVGVGEADSVDQKWSRSGNQGQQWSQGAITIAGSYSNVVIEVTATVGSGDAGDIAIDDVKLIPGACPAR